MTGKSVRASSSPSVDIQVDEMRALPAPGCSERPPLGDGSFSGGLLRAASYSLSKSPPFQISEGEVFPVRNLGDFGNSLLLAQLSTPQASTTSTCSIAVMQVAFGDHAVLFVRACCRLLPYLLSSQWEQWDVWIPRWSWVSMTVLFQASYQDQCICWCPELSLFLDIACLLCSHLLLTLCIWITSWATISSFKSPVSPSSARVGVAGMVLQSFKSFAGCASQVSASVKLSVALVLSLLWMSALEGVKLLCVMLHFAEHQALEYFLQAVQVIKGWASLSSAIYLFDSVLMMRECCTGLTLWMPTSSLICLEKSGMVYHFKSLPFLEGVLYSAVFEGKTISYLRSGVPTY